VRDVTVVNYRNRESAYRNTDYSWARQVRQQPQRQNPRETEYRKDRTPSTRAYSVPNSNRSWLNPYNRDSYNREPRGAPDTGNRSRGGSRPPAQYNTPVVRPEVPNASPDRFNLQNPRAQSSPPPTINRPDFNRSSRRMEPTVPRSRPDSPRTDDSRGSRGSFQRPQPAAPPAVNPPTAPNPPPAGNDQPSPGEGRGRLRSLGEG
jgi:hypothetical protein